LAVDVARGAGVRRDADGSTRHGREEDDTSMSPAQSAVHNLRQRFVDSPTSLGAQSRARRWEQFTSTFPQLSNMSVIDLGGRLETWRRSPVQPGHVHVLNLEKADGEIPAWAEFDHADACDLPDAIRRRRYDVVFSNSVIEHVGGHAQRVRFAETARSLADRHWVQTPYRYFPIEPHWLFPGFQFLPLNAKAVVAQRWPLVHTQPPDRATALRAALHVELLSRTEMQALFPASEIISEKVAGLAKSLVALKRA
jgi:hypothetical protein